MNNIISRLITLIMIFSIPLLADQATISITHQSMEIRLSPDEHLASIENDLQFKALDPIREIKFLLNKDVQIRKVESAGKSLSFKLTEEFDPAPYTKEADSSWQKEYEDAAELQITLSKPLKEGKITLIYSFEAQEDVDQAAFSREYIAYKVKAYIGKKGVFISPGHFWYPTLPDNLSRFDILVITPDTLQILTQGKLMLEEVVDNTLQTNWKIDYPADGVHLVGSRYQVQETKYKDISIFTYFFPESQDLAESYLNACQRYLGMYENLIGPYPFSKFAVVENFFPTGYGMPSYTLLGSQVIRLPFIIYTSLGHEVAHNWWGNSVYIDYNSGNWCEGLTTYFADHYYKEMKNKLEAAQYRRDLNRDFTVYVKDQKDFPLSDFSERTESASRAIGYGKSALVFHQLRQIIGDSLFFKSFQKFYQDFKFKDASWGDIQRTAEAVSGKDLDWFFEQWIQRKGAPQLELLSTHYRDGQIEIKLKQLQEDLYHLYIPIEILQTDSSSVVEYVWLKEQEQMYQFPSAKIPLMVTVDPYYDLLRKLEKDEIPPTLSEIFAQEKALVVLPDKCSPGALEHYQTFANTMTEGEEGVKIVKAQEMSDSDLENNSLYILGTPAENSIFSKIAWEEDSAFKVGENQFQIHDNSIPGPDDVSILIHRRSNSDENICLIAMGENYKAGRVANLMRHYGKYSYLLFTDGKNQIKEIFQVSKSPMIFRFSQN